MTDKFLWEATSLSLCFLALAAWTYYQDVCVRKLKVRQSRVKVFLGAAVVSYPLLIIALPYTEIIRAHFGADAVKISAVIFLVLCIAILLFLLPYRSERDGRENLRHIAQQFGLVYDPEGQIPLPAGLLSVPILEERREPSGQLRFWTKLPLPIWIKVPMLQSLREFTHVLRDDKQNCECAIFKYRIFLGGGEEEVQTAAGYRLSCVIPAFLLKPKTLFDRVNVALGEKDVNFPTHPLFSSHYRLVCSDEDESRVCQLFSNGLLPFFEREPSWTIGCRQDWAGMYKYRVVIEPHDLPNFYQKTKGIVEAIALAARARGRDGQLGSRESRLS